MTGPLLDIQGLNVTFPTRDGVASVVKDLSLRMGQEKVGIVGESGSGKSMTAKAILGLVKPPGRVTAARMALNGMDLGSLSPRQWRELRGTRMSMILQDPKFSLNPVIAVGHQIEETLLLHASLGKSVRRERALHILRAVGMDDPLRVYRSYPHELSGGMGQRVMIAMMLIASPELLIADEPTSALDVIVREQVLRLLDTLAAERKFGLILISHDLPMVARFCDRILVMYRGRVVETVRASELGNARHPYTRGLLSCLPSPGNRGRPLANLVRDQAWELSE